MISNSSLRHELARLMQSYDQNADPALSLHLFRALGWDEGEYRILPSRIEGKAGEYRLDTAGETTAYLFVSKQETFVNDVKKSAGRC